MQNVTERRAYVRIHLRAYACDKTCTLVLNGRRLTACLVDLSVGGARLRLQEPLGAPKDQVLAFSMDNTKDGGLLQNLTANVRWQSDREIGIQFETALEVGVSALQKLVS